MMPGGWELVLILVVIVLLFGSKRIPESMRSIGQGIRAFKDEMSSDKDKSKDTRNDQTTSNRPSDDRPRQS